MYKVMIVEDEIKIRDLLEEYLKRWQFEVFSVTEFDNVIKDFKTFDPHLIVMDINLPLLDGFHWCQKIRDFSKVPILITSSRTTRMDVVMGINIGADDYLYKPYDLDILLAKVNALLRRTYDYKDESLNILMHKNAILNLKDCCITFNEKHAVLTHNEFLILKALLEKKGSILPREELMRLLWEDESFVDDNTLTVNVTRLRRKLEDIGLGHWIQTKKKQGYGIIE